MLEAYLFGIIVSEVQEFTMCLCRMTLLIICLSFPIVADCEDASTKTFNGRLCRSLQRSPAQIKTFTASTIREIQTAILSAIPGTTILIKDGVYKLDGRMLTLAVPSVTIRSASSNRDKVILDGGYKSPSVFEISASDVTIADLTITSPYNHAIHVFTPRKGGNTQDTLIHNVHIVDPGQQAIKVNPTTDGAYLVNGIIECSLIELTAIGREKIRNNCYTGGIDAHRAQGWTVRDNEIKGFWCQKGLSEHAIHFWKGSQDTTVERNVLIDNARGIGFGMQAQKNSGMNTVCAPSSDHIGGVIRNNFITTTDKKLFSSDAGSDCGICLWYVCNTKVAENCIYSEQPNRTFSSIEWRFPTTTAEVINNVTNIPMLERDGALAIKSGNITNATKKRFENPSIGDLCLPYVVDDGR